LLRPYADGRKDSSPGFVRADLQQGIKWAPANQASDQGHKSDDLEEDTPASTNHAGPAQVKNHDPNQHPDNAIPSSFIYERHVTPPVFLLKKFFLVSILWTGNRPKDYRHFASFSLFFWMILLFDHGLQAGEERLTSPGRDLLPPGLAIEKDRLLGRIQYNPAVLAGSQMLLGIFAQLFIQVLVNVL
jgi:hypothetical protein